MGRDNLFQNWTKCRRTYLPSSMWCLAPALVILDPMFKSISGLVLAIANLCCRLLPLKTLLGSTVGLVDFLPRCKPSLTAAQFLLSPFSSPFSTNTLNTYWSLAQHHHVSLLSCCTFDMFYFVNDANQVVIDRIKSIYFFDYW